MVMTEAFIFPIRSRLALRPNLLSPHWLLGAIPPGKERPVYEADHPPLSRAEVQNEWSCTSTPHTLSRGGAILNMGTIFSSLPHIRMFLWSS
jgi:hypothetical protein